MLKRKSLAFQEKKKELKKKSHFILQSEPLEEVVIFKNIWKITKRTHMIIRTTAVNLLINTCLEGLFKKHQKLALVE